MESSLENKIWGFGKSKFKCREDRLNMYHCGGGTWWEQKLTRV
jgi:hypothetical protein